MKSLKIFSLPLLFMILLLSCSSDDGPSGNNMNDAIVGTWNLVELNISPAQDIDGDGTPSSNVLTELDCVSGTLTFRDDNLWNLAFDSVSVTSITGGLFNIRCSNFTSTASGSWQLQGNQLTLFFQNGTSIFYTLNGTRLTNTIGEDLPGFSSEVYEKQ